MGNSNMRKNLYGIDQMRLNADSIIKNLQCTSDFMIALDSEVGRLLMKDLVALLDDKFKLIYTETAKEEDRAMFRACKEIGRRWNVIIDTHNKATKDLENLNKKKERVNNGHE